MTARSLSAPFREGLARLSLALGAALVTALALEMALRVSGYKPARFLSPGELYSERARVFLDSYPTNPRQYFDIDLRHPATRARYLALGMPDVESVARRAPFAVEFRYNTLYFRDREPAPRPAGVTRVVVLGDSFTEGQGVKEPDTYPRRLARLLGAAGDRRFEVVSCARRGADFPGLYKMFEKSLAYDPDVVVHAMVLNDAARSPTFDAQKTRINDWILDRTRLLTGPPPSEPRPWEPRLFDFVADRIERGWVGRESTRWYLDMYGDANGEGWERTQGYLREMDRQMRARGGSFMIAAWPLLVDLDRYPFAAADETIASFCARAGIRRYDLRPALQGRPIDSLWVHPVDHHPNEVAHRIAAEALAGPIRQALPPSR